MSHLYSITCRLLNEQKFLTQSSMFMDAYGAYNMGYEIPTSRSCLLSRSNFEISQNYFVCRGFFELLEFEFSRVNCILLPTGYKMNNLSLFTVIGLSSMFMAVYGAYSMGYGNVGMAMPMGYGYSGMMGGGGGMIGGGAGGGIMGFLTFSK